MLGCMVDIEELGTAALGFGMAIVRLGMGVWGFGGFWRGSRGGVLGSRGK